MFIKEKIFNEVNRAIVVKQIVKALNYLETMKMVHRDLKPDNIMYAPPAGGLDDLSKVELKLIDFGFAKAIKSDNL